MNSETLPRIGLALIIGVVIFLLWGRLFPTPQTSKSFDDDMRDFAEMARKRARSNFNVTLDDSPESVKRVEEILEKIHQQWRNSPPKTDSEIGSEFVLWAAYLGEVIKKERPAARWQRDSPLGAETFPLVLAEQNMLFPIAWVQKRIENGEEDNVWTKYDLSLHRDRYKELKVDVPSKPSKN